jgi:hypothetical protein
MFRSLVFFARIDAMQCRYVYCFGVSTGNLTAGAHSFLPGADHFYAGANSFYTCAMFKIAGAGFYNPGSLFYSWFAMLIEELFLFL